MAKDDLVDSVEKFDDFDAAMFDAIYRKIEKKKMTLPSEILAFKLLKKANITKEERLLILTGMNYEQKSTLYEEAKSSLKKFKGDDGGQIEKSAIKLEPAYLAENEEALLAAGYVKAKGKNFDSRRGPRWSEGDFFETRATEVPRKFSVQKTLQT